VAKTFEEITENAIEKSIAKSVEIFAT